MSGRRIRKGGHGVTVELTGEGSDDATTELAFSEVRLLANGWAECREPADGSARRAFFPPERVVAVRVDDENEPAAAWS